MKNSYESDDQYLAREEARKRDVARSKREKSNDLVNMQKIYDRLFDVDDNMLPR